MDLATWWPLFSNPDEYADEAEWILRAIDNALGRRPADILELGSGGGNTASHLRHHARMTLVDLSHQMLEVSRRLIPDARHEQGDMRTVRLGKSFDAVLIHDAVMYMTTDDDLVAALTTARTHVAQDGAVIVLPDFVTETIESRVETGGRDATDGSLRGLRYIEWTHTPTGHDTTFVRDYAILVREADGSVEVYHDQHRLGVFTRAAWREAFTQAGFAPPIVSTDPWRREVFVALPASSPLQR